jgi:hypothetical protein
VPLVVWNEFRDPPVSPKTVKASEEFLGQRDDNDRRASRLAELVQVLVPGHLADEFGASKPSARSFQAIQRGCRLWSSPRCGVWSPFLPTVDSKASHWIA